MFIFLAFAPGFWMPYWPPLTPYLQPTNTNGHHPCSIWGGGKRGSVVQTHYFPFPCREWPRRIVCECGLSRIKDRANLLEINGIIAIILTIFLTLSLTTACTSVEGHWGELDQLTHAVLMAQPTPNNRHHSERRDQFVINAKILSVFPGACELGLLPLFMKLWFIICKKRKLLLVPKNKLMSIKRAFDLERA